MTASKEVTLAIDGMTCSSCSGTVTRVLEGIEGITSVSVVLTSNIALVSFDAAVCTSTALVDAVEAVGFGASVLEEHDLSADSSAAAPVQSTLKTLVFTVERIDISVFRMQIFENSVLALDGVSAVSFSGELDNVPTITGRDSFSDRGSANSRLKASKSGRRSSLSNIMGPFLSGFEHLNNEDVQVKVTVDEDKSTGPRALQALCESHGLIVRLNAMGSFLLSERLLRTQLAEMQRYWDLFVFASLFTAPVVVISMAVPMDMTMRSHDLMYAEVVRGLTTYNLVLFLLSTPVQFLSGAKFHVKALSSVRTGDMGMDFMISTGTMAAYFYSVANTIKGLLAGNPASDADLYFETAAVLITVVLLGKYLEAFARGKTASSIHTLTSLRPKQARLLIVENGVISQLGEDGEQLIEASLVQRGDVLRLVAGETVPADGEVLSGHVGVDESMLTGESMLVDRGVGATAIGGTMVVEGTATIRVVACGDKSVLGTILSTVQSAQASKPRIQETADRVSAYFVPAIAVISLITFLAWLIAAQLNLFPHEWYSNYSTSGEFAFFFALAVWVSACPCAFGLATPTAVLVATGLAASQGLLIRRGAALQTAAELTAVAFDKTGTLTEGKMKVTDCRYFSSGDELGIEVGATNSVVLPAGLLRLVLALESRSAHPIARAVAQFCASQLRSSSASSPSPTNTSSSNSRIPSEEKLDVELGNSRPNTDESKDDDLGHADEANELEEQELGNIELIARSVANEIDVDDDAVENLAGKGMRLRQPEGDLLIGSSSWLVQEGCSLPLAASTAAEGLRSGGKVVVFVASAGKLVLLIGLSDRVRKDAARTVAALAKMGVATYMVTGDNALTAAAIGRAVGIPKGYILASAKPEDKEGFIAVLQRRGLTVGFVGDGTNDSPALARANVGFALGGGTDLAIDAGDVIIYNNELPSLITCIELSKSTMSRIFINYFWALVYNCLLVPLAAGVFFPSFGFALQPMYAGAAMAASSVSVVLSSLCLLLFKPSMQVRNSSKTKASDNKAETVSSTATGGVIDPQECDGMLCDCPASSSPGAASAAVVAKHFSRIAAEKISSIMGTSYDRGGGHGGKAGKPVRKIDGADAPDVASVLRELTLGNERLSTVLRKSPDRAISSNEANGASELFQLPVAGQGQGQGKDHKALLLPHNASNLNLSCGCRRSNCRCGERCSCEPGVKEIARL